MALEFTNYVLSSEEERDEVVRLLQALTADDVPFNLCIRSFTPGPDADGSLRRVNAWLQPKSGCALEAHDLAAHNFYGATLIEVLREAAAAYARWKGGVSRPDPLRSATPGS